VFRLRDRRGEETETREGGFELLLPKPGGMCYHHNLAELEGQPRTRWTQKMNVINLFIGSCAGVWKAESAMYVV
jgi:hypothetical protein